MSGVMANPAFHAHYAVLMGASAGRLRAVIERCALGASGGSAGDEEAIERRRRAAVNTPVPRRAGEEGELPLIAANGTDRGDLVCVLVEHGADVDPAIRPGMTPLAACVLCGEEAGAEASVRVLLQKGADARAPVGSGGKSTCTAAHYCVGHPFLHAKRPWSPRLRCLESLVRDGGADINAPDSDGLTPLAWMSDWIDGFKATPAPGSGDGAEGWPAALLGLGADPNLCGEGQYAAPPALHWIRSVHPERQGLLVCWLRALRAGGARFSGGVFNGKGDTPLTLAARRGLVEVVRFLLEEARVDPHEPNRLTGKLPLTCCELSEPVIAALLAGGADANGVDSDDVRPLERAVSWQEGGPCDPGAALALLRAGASTDGYLYPLFLEACLAWPPYYLSDKRIRVLEELLRRTPEADRRATIDDDDEGRLSAIDLLAGDGGWLGERWGQELDAPFFDIEDLDPLPGGDIADAPDDGEEMQARVDATLARSIAAHRRMVAALVLAGAPVLEKNKAAVAHVIQSCALPLAARRATRATRELAARRSDKRRWRAHDALVDLAFERRELNDADARLAATRARLVELERAVAEAEGAEVTVSGPAAAASEENEEEEEEEEPSVVGGVVGGGKEEDEEEDGDDGQGEEGGESK